MNPWIDFGIMVSIMIAGTSAIMLGIEFGIRHNLKKEK